MELGTVAPSLLSSSLQIVPEICGQQRVREDLLAAIAETERARDLVQARLALRHQRPEKEQCHDPVQSKLLSEVQQFTANISRWVATDWLQ